MAELLHFLAIDSDHIYNIIIVFSGVPDSTQQSRCPINHSKPCTASCRPTTHFSPCRLSATKRMRSEMYLHEGMHVCILGEIYT